jgi:transposase
MLDELAAAMARKKAIQAELRDSRIAIGEVFGRVQEEDYDVKAAASAVGLSRQSAYELIHAWEETLG